MDWAAVWDLEAVPEYAAAFLMFGLAAWLVWLRPRSAAHWAFSLFLFFRAGAMVVATFAQQGLARDGLTWRYLQPLVGSPIVFMLLFFLAVYPRRSAWVERRPWALVALFLAPLAFDVAYVIRPSLFWTHEVNAGGALVQTDLGPLYVVSTILLAYAFAAWLLVREHAREVPGPRRTSMLLVALAFTLNASFDVTRTVRNAWDNVAGFASVHDPVIVGVQLGYFVLAAGLLGASWLRLASTRRAAADPDTRRQVARFFLWTAVAVLSGILFIGAAALKLVWTDILLIGLWRLTLPLLATYALVKHRLFDLDVKIKWTISKGTLTGMFIAVFLIVSQLTENFFEQRSGENWIFGGIAAGLMLFAISPLQRVAERVADTALPGVKPVHEMAQDDRVSVYREAARIAWADGVLDRSERAMLDGLAERLHLSDKETVRIEREAAGPAPKRRARSA